MTTATITHPDIQISGDVRIDPQAVIAPGVILQATANYHIAIAANACIGAGSIVQAHQGNIEIHPGAIIGAGTLIIGQCSIGENACIGYGTTIFFASVLAATLLPPHSLLGSPARQNAVQPPPVKKTSPSPTIPVPTASPSTDPWQELPLETSQVITPPTAPSIPTPSAVEESPVTPPSPPTEPEIIPTTSEPITAAADTNIKSPVVGQVYINQLLMTLFPHQNSIKPPHDPTAK